MTNESAAMPANTQATIAVASSAGSASFAPVLAEALPRMFPGAPFALTAQRDAFELTVVSPHGPARLYIPLRLEPEPDAGREARAALERKLAQIALLARSS